MSSKDNLVSTDLVARKSLPITLHGWCLANKNEHIRHDLFCKHVLDSFV